MADQLSGFLREKQLRPHLLPVAHSTLWAMVREGRFPQPVRFKGSRVTAWRATDVQAWIASQDEQAVA